MKVRSALHMSTLVIIVASILSACTPPVSTPTPSAIVATPLSHSAKGYELYSWQANDQWHFALVPGTNRVKSRGEITANENTVMADGWCQ